MKEDVIEEKKKEFVGYCRKNNLIVPLFSKKVNRVVSEAFDLAIKKTIAIKDKEIDGLRQKLDNCKEANLRMIKDGRKIVELETAKADHKDLNGMFDNGMYVGKKLRKLRESSSKKDCHNIKCDFYDVNYLHNCFNDIDRCRKQSLKR